MKKKIIIIITICLFICACEPKVQKSIKPTKINPAKETKEDELETKISEQLENMTIEEKIGQMLIINYRSKSFDSNLKKIFSDIKPGGFILFGGNITTFNNTKNFISDIKLQSDIPLIVAVDEEGGRIQKIQMINDKEILDIPSMQQVGNTNDEQLAYDVGTVIAKELMTLGINVTFAPVLDIVTDPNNKTIGDRSFGNNKEIVSKMAIQVAKGLEDTGIIPTYKHFPGHGDTTTNSHTSLPVINKDYDELYANELQPYIKAIENNAKIIMVGHLAFPEITGDYIPASLSPKIINDILIKKLNYRGLIITDALDMGAIVNNYGEEETVKMAIDAGVDLLLMPKDIFKTVEYIKNNVSEERINKSVRKILSFKYTSLKDYDILNESYLNNKEEQQIIEKIK